MRSLAQGPALPDGSKVLHIGFPKTGTTALQAALHACRSDLVDQGVLNASPKNTRHPYGAARFAAGEPMRYGAGADEATWHAVLRRFDSSTARVTLFSSEALYLASEEHARSITAQIGGDVHVVVTLRSFAHQLRSRWQQYVIGGSRATFDEWATNFLDNTARLQRNGPDGVLDTWGAAVGDDRVIFVVSDPDDRDVLFRRFEEMLGLTVSTLVPPRLDNAALSLQGSEFLRRFNRLDTSKRTDPTSERAEVLRRGAHRIRHMPGLQRDRALMPRWAAERANEVATGWIERLEASSATVVGRPEDLLVDIEGLPERLVAPDRIDVADAARFAHAYWDAAMRHHEEAQARSEDLVDLTEVPTRELIALVRSRVVGRIAGRRGTRA